MAAAPRPLPTHVASRWRSPARWGRWLLAGALLSAALPACGPTSAGLEADLAASFQEVKADNGLSTNGLSTNGLSTNGLSTNGLSTNGLSTSSFSTWFNLDPALNEQVMVYIVRCAMGSAQSLEWTNPVTLTRYKWDGMLGLAPDWSGGAPATLEEQQVISACLAAHANKYSKKIPISVLGMDAKGKEIAVEPGELTTFPEQEACFFGNLFNGEGLFVGNDRQTLNSTESTARACGLSTATSGTVIDCPQLTHVGACGNYCAKAKKSDAFYTFCATRGVKYRAITTRLRSEEIYKCGDGVCQFTERCGTGKTYDSCVDCGPCP